MRPLGSENQFQGKLNLPRRTRQRSDRAEVRIAEVLRGRPEVSRVEQIEELGAELHATRLPPQRKLLVQAEIEVEDRLCSRNVPACVAERLRAVWKREGSPVEIVRRVLVRRVD